MIIKKYSGLFILLLVLGFTFEASAQQADVPTPERQAERMSKVLEKRLDLSDDQAEKVLKLNIDIANKQDEILQNEEIGYFDKVEKLKKLTEKRSDEFKKILSVEQFQKFYELNHRKRNK